MQIFPNGRLFYSFGTHGDLDEDGNPIPASATQDGDCICTITTASEDRNTYYEGGVAKRATYTVTCNMEDVDENFCPRVIRLVHDRKGDLGSFLVHRIEYYDITQTIELWV